MIRWKCGSVLAMAPGDRLVHEKLDQAVEILREQDVDLWLTLVRETLLTSDPCLDLIAGTYCAWQGAFLVSATGERIAIVGRFDAPRTSWTSAHTRRSWATTRASARRYARRSSGSLPARSH